METLYKEIVWRVTLGSVKAPGPYQSQAKNKRTERLREFCRILCEVHTTLAHPTPIYDGIDIISNNHLFGFSSRAQLRKWFSLDERISLKAHGFSLFRVEVSEPSRKGIYQTAFLKDGIVSSRKMMLVRSDVMPCTKKNPCPVCFKFGV